MRICHLNVFGIHAQPDLVMHFKCSVHHNILEKFMVSRIGKRIFLSWD